MVHIKYFVILFQFQKLFQIKYIFHTEIPFSPSCKTMEKLLKIDFQLAFRYHSAEMLVLLLQFSKPELIGCRKAGCEGRATQSFTVINSLTNLVTECTFFLVSIESLFMTTSSRSRLHFHPLVTFKS